MKRRRNDGNPTILTESVWLVPLTLQIGSIFFAQSAGEPGAQPRYLQPVGVGAQAAYRGCMTARRSELITSGS